MTNIALTIITITYLLLASCQGGSQSEKQTEEKTEVYSNDLARSLKTLIFDKVQNQSQINSIIALESVVELFESSSRDTTSTEIPIDLYVIYDTDLWSEYDEKETFQITLAHQSVESKVLFETRITLIFDPSDFDKIEEFYLRFEKDLDNFKMIVKNSPGFKKSLHSTPSRIEIIKEEI